MALGSTQPLKEMSTRSISWGKGGRCVRLTTLPPSCVVMKSGNLNLLEPSGSLQACNGTALPLPVVSKDLHKHFSVFDLPFQVHVAHSNVPYPSCQYSRFCNKASLYTHKMFPFYLFSFLCFELFFFWPCYSPLAELDKFLHAACGVT